MPIGQTSFGETKSSLNDLQSKFAAYQNQASGLEDHKVYQRRQQSDWENFYQGLGHGVFNAAESTANLIPDIFGARERTFTFADYVPENPESQLSTITSDMTQAVTGLLMGGPVKSGFQTTAKQGLKHLRKKQLRKAGKRGAMTPSRFWEVTKEGAVLGGIAEFMAFRGQDEGLILSNFFETNPSIQNLFEEATSEEGWENIPTAELAQRMQQSWSGGISQSAENLTGRAAFAAEGALIGAVFNHVIALGKAAFKKVGRKSDKNILKAAEGGDIKGSEAADATEAQTATTQKNIKEEAEDLAHVHRTRDKLAEAEADHAEATGRAGTPSVVRDIINEDTLVPSTWDVVPEDAAEGITKDTKFESEVVDKGATVQLKGTKIRINRGLVNDEYTSAASTPNANTGDNSFNASDIFNNADEYEQYLVNKEKARLFFPKGAKELEGAYSKRLEKHAINEAKRQGLGNFYKYEFNAPKHLKHLELTEVEQAALLMDDALDAAGNVKPEKIKQFTKLIKELNGTAPTKKSIQQIMDEAEKLFRPDTTFSDVGTKYFSGRVFSFFYKHLKPNIDKTTTATTFNQAVGQTTNPTTLVEALQEHLLNNLDDFAEANQMEPSALVHRLLKGRGDFKHYYNKLTPKERMDVGFEMDVASMKEMNIRLLAYRMEQAVSLKRFKRLTEEIDKLTDEQLNANQDLMADYIIELEKQGNKIDGMQKLRQASGRILASWKSLKNPLMDSLERISIIKAKGGAKHLRKHAARANAIFKATDSSLDGAAAASDYLGKTSSVIDIHNEYWLNSILSGTKTQMVNTISTGIHMYYKPMEGLIGSAIGNPEARSRLASVLVRTAMINAQVVRVAAVLGLNNLRHLGGLLDNKTFHANRAKLFAKGQEDGSYAQAIQSVAGAKKSFRRGTGTLSEGSDLFDVEPPKAISGDILGEAASKTAKNALDYIGNFIRIPSRFMIGTDELFKQISFRANAMGRLAGDAVDAGYTSKEDISRFISENFRGVIRESGRRHSRKAIQEEAALEYKKLQTSDPEGSLAKYRTRRDFLDEYEANHFDAEKSELSELGMDWAEDVTFTRGLDKDLLALQDAGKINKGTTSWMKDMQDTVHRHPWMRLIMPFIRTPVNILKFPLQRTPFIMSPNGKLFAAKEFDWIKNLHMRYQADMASGDVIKQAEAKGRLYAGNFYWLSLTAAASSGIITGGGPSNPRERRNKMATGWRPYSFKYKDTYIAYGRLDPFSTVLGLAADLYEKYAELGRDGDIEEDWGQAVMLGAMYSLSNNIADKSYLAGINNVLQALIEPETKLKSLLKRQTTSYIPKAISQWTPLTDDIYMKKTYGLLEGLMSRVPTLNQQIEPMRNYLGEPMESMYAPTVWAAGFNPFTISKDNNDPVLSEIAALGYGFGAPTPRINGLPHLDMRRFQKDGRSAFDLYQERVGTVKIGGKNIREMLTSLFNSKNYKTASLMNERNALMFDSTARDPRVKMIKSVMGRFRAKARQSVLKDHTELEKAYRSFKQAEAIEKRNIING